MKPMLALVALVAVGCGDTQDDADSSEEALSEPQTFQLANTGNPDREGHTPRGFEGFGTGLFTGDNLNPGFPEGDGVQIFLSVNLRQADNGALLDGEWVVDSAILEAGVEPDIAGTPFADLGDLMVDEVVFNTFSAALWNLEPPSNALNCTFATSPAGPFECDLAGAVQSALDEGRRFVNFRLRFDDPGDSDAVQDMVFFFDSDVNATEAGLFNLTVTARQR